jgi:hypothetical protein
MPRSRAAVFVRPYVVVEARPSPDPCNGTDGPGPPHGDDRKGRPASQHRSIGGPIELSLEALSFTSVVITSEEVMITVRFILWL